MPIKKLDSESAIFEIIVFKSFAIAGKPGRYMSMEKGARAVNDPRIRIRKKYFSLVISLQN